MFSFSLIERRHVGGKSFPLRADIRSNEHRLFAKQKDEEFTKLVFVELSTLQRTKDAVVVTHLTASVQAQSVVEPRVVLVDLLCLGKKVVCVKIYRVIYISNQNIKRTVETAPEDITQNIPMTTKGNPVWVKLL